ncbi:MAG: T9SS type A sorting domain-containing protein, partial [Syntrophothermus sp.]
MPTRKMVDNIYKKSEIKLAPYPYAPVGNQNELVPKFIEHNSKIEEQRLAAGGLLGQLTGGTKKDVVLSNKIIDPARPNHVCIYGWHQLNGVAIQPLTNIHIDSYVDYSHGIRLLNNEVLIDGQIKLITNILKDNILYKLFSDETGVMTQPTYIRTTTDVEEVEAQANNFNLLQNYPNPFNPDTNIQYYVPENSKVTIKIYDILGNEIKELVNDEKQQGSYTINFNASELSNGVYIYRMTAGNFTTSRKMILLK